VVQFLKQVLELQPYHNALIAYGGLIYSQLHSRLYPLSVWTCNKLHDSV